MWHDSTAVKRIEKLTYLVILINDKWNPSVEIKIRIEKALVTFVKMKHVLCDQTLNLNLHTGQN